MSKEALNQNSFLEMSSLPTKMKEPIESQQMGRFHKLHLQNLRPNVMLFDSQMARGFSSFFPFSPTASPSKDRGVGKEKQQGRKTEGRWNLKPPGPQGSKSPPAFFMTVV